MVLKIYKKISNISSFFINILYLILYLSFVFFLFHYYFYCNGWSNNDTYHQYYLYHQAINNNSHFNITQKSTQKSIFDDPIFYSNGLFLLRPVGYGRTNNHIIMFREFLLYSKQMKMKAVIENNFHSFMKYIDIPRLSNFASIIRITSNEVVKKCKKNIMKISSICPYPTSSQIQPFWEKIKKGEIEPYQFWTPLINYVHATHRRDHSRSDCSKYYHEYRGSKCFHFLPEVTNFLSFDYSMNPSLFYKFYENFHFIPSIHMKIKLFNSFYNKKFGISSFHYLAVHLRFSDLSVELPSDLEIISTIKTELSKMKHLPNLKLFIATEKHTDRRIIQIKTIFSSILLEDSLFSLNFSSPLEQLFYDMQICVNADHFIGLESSTLTFNVNMMRFFGPNKHPVTSSNYWPHFLPDIKGINSSCCFPKLQSSQCRDESFSCYPYLNSTLMPDFYLRNENEIDTVPFQNNIFVKYDVTQNKNYGLIDFHKHLYALRFIFVIGKMWHRNIIIQKEFQSFLQNNIKSDYLGQYVPFIYGQQYRCFNTIDFSTIWGHCTANASMDFVNNIFKGKHDPFQYFPLDFLISSILPSLKPSEKDCLKMYQQSVTNHCIVFDIQQTELTFTFDWSYHPSLLFNFHKYFFINSDLVDQFCKSYPIILSVYISPFIYSQINSIQIYIDTIEHELNLFPHDPFNDNKYLFIFPQNFSSPLYISLLDHFKIIIIKHPLLSGSKLFFFYSFLSSRSQRFIGDESIVSFNINFLRVFGANTQYPSSQSSFWPSSLDIKRKSNTFDYYSLFNSHHNFSSIYHYYTFPLPSFKNSTHEQ